MTAHDYRNQLIEAKQRFGRNEITSTQLYAAADAYINAIKEFKQRTGNKKLNVPTRGHLLRMT